MLGTSELLAASREQQRLGAGAAAAIPPAVLETVQFPYDRGYDFVSVIYQQGGWEAVNRLFADPPVSTEQVLHLDKYLAGEQPIPVTAPVLPASLATDWRAVDSNVLGEQGWRQVVAALNGPAAGLGAATGWGGDRYALFQKGTGPSYMVASSSRWDSPAEAEEFAALYTSGMQLSPEVEELTEDLLSEEPVRMWKRDGLYTALKRVGENVYLVVGPDQAAVTEVVAAAE